MGEENLKRKGIIVLIYSIFGAGIVNFTLWLFIAMGMGIAEMALWAKYLLGFFTATLSIAFICTLTGGMVLVANKKWGKAVALFGIFVSAIHALIFILFFLPNVIKPWGAAIIMPLLLATSYLISSMVLRKKVKLSESIGLKNKSILVIFACAIVCLFFSLKMLNFTIFAVKSHIDDNSSLASHGEAIIFSMNGDIYTISMTGGESKRLTSNSLSKEKLQFSVKDPKFSADGKMICFSKEADRTSRQIEAKIPFYSDIYIANADGSNERIVYKGKEDSQNSSPSFSPDGKKIVFIHSMPAKKGGKSSICEINIEGASFREIGPYLQSPVYSSDGKSVYGLKEELLSLESYKMDSDSLDRAEENLKINIVKIDLDSLAQSIIGQIPKKSEVYNLSLSPDAKKVVFIHLSEEDKHMPGEYRYQIYITNIDGSNVRKLTNDSGPKNKPTFTQDGTRIIFIHGRSIKIMNIDGSDMKILLKI